MPEDATPTPWTADVHRSWGICVRGGMIHNGMTGKYEPRYIMFKMRHKADAELIVQAVNAYQPMREALDKTTDWLLANAIHTSGCVHGDGDMSCSCGLTQASNEACAALQGETA